MPRHRGTAKHAKAMRGRNVSTETREKKSKTETTEQKLMRVLGVQSGLAPSADQVRRLEESPEFSSWGEKSLKDWFRALRDDGNRPIALYDVAGYYKRSIWLDQLSRARQIVEHMREAGKRNLFLMDGHGRFVFAVVYWLRYFEEDVNKFTIHLVDRDENVNRWHQKFIPCEAIRGSIFDYKSDKNTCVYANFCGLQGQYDELLKFLEKQCGVSFVSFSIRGGGISVDGTRFSKPKGKAGMAKMVTKLNKKFSYSIIAQRQSFLTLKFTGQQRSVVRS